jgi:site-specific DNA recombinase
MRRAIGIKRVSVLTKETTSPERQGEIVTDAATRRGSDIVGWADDLDISATKYPPMKRPQLSAWLARPDEFDEIIFWRMDRFVRKPGDLAQMIEWSREHGKGLVSATESFDLDDPWGEAIAYITAIFARMESVNTSIRVTGAHEFLRQHKRWGGGRPPYWYATAPNPDGNGLVLVIDQEGADLVNEAADRVIAGEALNSIIADFNRRRILSPQDRSRMQAIATAKDKERQELERPVRDRPWGRAALNTMLHSPALLGYVVHRAGTVSGEDGMPLTMAEPVMSETKWDALQRALSDLSRPSGKQRTQTPSLLLRVAFCALCSNPLYRQSTVWNGKVYPYYMCRSATKAVEQYQPCDALRIRADELDEWATGKFLGQVGNVEVMARAYRSGSDTAEQIAQVRRSLTTVRSEFDNGGYSYPGGQEEYDTRVTRLSTRLRELAAEPVVEPGYELRSTGRTFGQVWEDASVPERRKLMTDAGFKVMYAKTRGGTVLASWSIDPDLADRAARVAAGERVVVPDTSGAWERVMTSVRKGLTSGQSAG